MVSKKILKVMKNPNIAINYVLSKSIARVIPDKTLLIIKYKLALGKDLNLENPQSFNEKLQWLKLYDRKTQYTQLADKYEVKQYISETIGEEYLIPLLGVYNSFDEIVFESLPKQFVLKPNHTSGDIYICIDKSKINYAELEKLVTKWIKREYFWFQREWPYKNIKPRIICEKYMLDESGIELKDYKFMCFNGEVKCIFVCSNRKIHKSVDVDIYDTDWNKMPFTLQDPNSGKLISKPKEYEKMFKFAQRLSNGIPFVRVDFYQTNEQLYFGEMTFYPCSGFGKFSPETYDCLLGSWLELPKIKTK